MEFFTAVVIAFGILGGLAILHHALIYQQIAADLRKRIHAQEEKERECTSDLLAALCTALAAFLSDKQLGVEASVHRQLENPTFLLKFFEQIGLNVLDPQDTHALLEMVSNMTQNPAIVPSLLQKRKKG